VAALDAREKARDAGRFGKLLPAEREVEYLVIVRERRQQVDRAWAGSAMMQ
jgi:hypothetical protein